MTRFACSDCGHRQAGAGDCTACGEGPVLDLESSGTVEMLQQQDRDRADRRRSLALWIALPVGMLVGGVFAGVLPGVLAAIPLPIPFSLPIKVIVLMVLVTLAIMQLIVRLFPAKVLFKDLEPEAKSMRDGAMGMRAAPSRDALVKGALIIGAGALVVGLGTFATTYGDQVAAEQAQDAQAAYAKLSTCLLGDATGTGVEGRLRNVELAVESTPAEPWPGRCNEHAKALYDSLEDAQGYAGLRAVLGSKLGCNKACDLEGSKAELGAMLAAANAAGLRHEMAPDVTPPPTHGSAPLSAERFPMLGTKKLRLVDYTYLGDELAALMHEPGVGLSLCEIDFASGADRLACQSLFEGRTPIAVSSAELLRDGERPVVHGVTKADIRTEEEGKRPRPRRPAMGAFGLGSSTREAPKKTVQIERGAFGVDGDPVSVYFGEQSAMASGVLVERKGKDHRATRIASGASKGGFDIKVEDLAAGPWAAGDYVAWVARKGGELTLFQQKVGASGSREGSVKAVGPVPTHPGRPTFCRAGGMRAALVGDAMTFFSDEGWSAPVVAAGTEQVGETPKPKRPSASASASAGRYAVRGPKDNPDPHIARAAALRDAAEFGMLGLLNSGAGGENDTPGRSFDSGLGLGSRSSRDTSRTDVADPPSFTCANGAATRTTHRVSGDTVTITQLRCTVDGCTSKRTRVTQLPIKQVWMVADLGGRVAMLWRSPTGALRMRVAPIEELATARDTIVLDAAEYGGPSTGSRQFFVHGEAAVILFVHEGLHALRIGADGSARPIQR